MLSILVLTIPVTTKTLIEEESMLAGDRHVREGESAVTGRSIFLAALAAIDVGRLEGAK